jgi:LEA14-like dessication related protein
MRNLLLIGGAAAAAFFLLRRKKTAAENIQVDPIDIAIDLERSSLSRIYYRVKLKLINNESASVNVSSVNLNILANGRAIGTINNTTGFVVQGGTDKVINIDASISSIGAIGLIYDLITQGLSIDLLVSGVVNTDLGAVNVRFNKQF